MRGKQLDEEDAKIQVRITPACAGKTLGRGSLYGRGWDHPRVCGENFLLFVLWVFPVGSPPRVRGKREIAEPVFIHPRITPACAGKTLEGIRCSWGNQDHPRVCGENTVRRRTHYCAGGSPPRVRGKRNLVPVNIPRVGITPACAGKTSVFVKRSPVLKDHPRVCGENSA